MTITERAALEGLRLRCIDELAKGNRRKATQEEWEDIYARFYEKHPPLAPDAARDLTIYALFDALQRWLDPTKGYAAHSPNLIAGIAIDILNKEGESGRATV